MDDGFNLLMLKANAKTLGLIQTKNTVEQLVHAAEESQQTYATFLNDVLSAEIKYRQDKAQEKRIKEAGFPYPKYLKDFDLGFCKSISKKQFNQLAELTWIDGVYNLILSGPPGVGKTHLAIALAYHACERGYKSSYTTMQSLMQCLKTAEIDRRSKTKLNRIKKSHLLVIDEVGYLPITAMEGNLFFQLISDLQEQTSIIITTNKGFEEWAEFLDDPALATAILDRLSYQCDRIKMSGKSYRLENRKSFLRRMVKMRFKKNVSAELRAILREQLHKYKRENKDITEEEMKELEDWVAAGNSPYDNPYNGYREDGWPLDFISTIRDIEEENRWFESLSEEEKEELRHPKPSSTFEELDLDACLAE